MKYRGIIVFESQGNEKREVIIFSGENYVFVDVEFEKPSSEKDVSFSIGDDVFVSENSELTKKLFENENRFLERKIVGNLSIIDNRGKKKEHRCSYIDSILRYTNERQFKLCERFQKSEDNDHYCGNDCPFRHFFISKEEQRNVEMYRRHLKAVASILQDPDDYWNPQTKNSMNKRHILLATFLITHFGKEFLTQGPVLDVGGGFGELSFILFTKFDVKCVVVDPKRIERIDEDMEQTFPRIEEPFDADFIKNHSKLIQECSLIVGLHADEAIEEIVEGCEKQNKKFCIVPCCAVSKREESFFDFQQFLEYLMGRTTMKIGTDFLNMKGRNKIIFSI